MYDDILPQELPGWLDRQAQIIDVREPWEFASGRVPGSVNVPLDEFLGRLPELEAPIVLVCAHGYRSSAVAAFLDRQGFGAVANLVGGVESWVEAGFELEH